MDAVAGADVVEAKVVAELGKFPNEAGADVVALAVGVEDTPKESETGAATLVVTEPPRLVPTKKKC